MDEGTEKFLRALRDLGVYDEVKRICLARGVTSVAALYGKGRSKHVALARHEAMYFLRQKFNWSYPATGQFFNRDHTTVISAIRKVEVQKKREQDGLDHPRKEEDHH